MFRCQALDRRPYEKAIGTVFTGELVLMYVATAWSLSEKTHQDTRQQEGIFTADSYQQKGLLLKGLVCPGEVEFSSLAG